MQSMTDEEIAAKVQRGDTQAFGVLVERYEPKMLRYARKFLFGVQDAEDLVQEVFVKAYINIQGFQTQRRFSPWLYRIAHNEFLNALKKKTRQPLLFFEPDTLFPHPISPEFADRDTLERELHDALVECLDEVDRKYREPLILYFFEDLNCQEIAQVMQIPVSTVGVRLKRGKESLKKKYAEKHML